MYTQVAFPYSLICHLSHQCTISSSFFPPSFLLCNLVLKGASGRQTELTLTARGLMVCYCSLGTINSASPGDSWGGVGSDMMKKDLKLSCQSSPHCSKLPIRRLSITSWTFFIKKGCPTKLMESWNLLSLVIRWIQTFRLPYMNQRIHIHNVEPTSP